MEETLQAIRDAKLPWFLEHPSPDVYLRDDYLVVDFETTNKDNGSALNEKNDIVLATWADKDNTYYKWGGIYEQGELLTAINKARFIVAHHAKFELQWLSRIGIDASRLLVYDTLLGDYVLAGNRRWRLDLDSVAQRYNVPVKQSYIKHLLHSGVCPSEMPRSKLLEYGLGDTINEREIFLQQRNRLRSSGLLAILYTRCLTSVVLADIESRGVQLDADRVREEYERVDKELAELELALNSKTGGINAGSTKQLGEFLYDTLGFQEICDRNGKAARTPAGKRKCDSDTISRLVSSTAAQKEFQELIVRRIDLAKKHQFLTKFKECCDENRGILYARYNQSITQTHRLSSSGSRYKVQFQNIPRQYKSLFKARLSDWRVGEADGAQLEFRVAAHLGRDLQAARDVRDKVDVHKNTASSYLVKAVSEVLDNERQDHKPKTFEPLYGKMGGDAATRAYVEYFHNRYAGIFGTQTEWTWEVLKNKELTTEWGMKFYWPDTELIQYRNGRTYITNTTSIFNYPVQSLATAEIIPISLVFAWHRAKAMSLESFVVNTVHDSVIWELAPGEVEMFKAISLQSFTNDVYKYLKEVYNVQFTVPLGVEVKIGNHWGEKQYGKESWDVEPLK